MGYPMSNRKYILLIGLLLLSFTAMAEVVVLRSGQSVKGEIVLQNEDVVIIRSNNGMRYQYPMNEVLSIQKEEQETVVQEETTTSKTKKRTVSAKRFFFFVNLTYAPSWLSLRAKRLVFLAALFLEMIP